MLVNKLDQITSEMPKLVGPGIFFFTPLHRRLALINMRSLLPFDKFKIACRSIKTLRLHKWGRGTMPKQKKPRGRPPMYPFRRWHEIGDRRRFGRRFLGLALDVQPQGIAPILAPCTAGRLPAPQDGPQRSPAARYGWPLGYQAFY